MRILIDLSILRHPYCGLGQIALNYGRWYGENAATVFPSYRITLLVPSEFEGRFGTTVDYLVARDIYRFLPALMPSFDVWHSIHQLSPFRPASRHTRRILTIHDVNFMYEKAPRKRQRYLKRLQRECDQSDTLCFISKFAQSDAAKYLNFGGKPQHIIYNGVEDLRKGEQRKPAVTADGQPFFLSLGVVKAKKNLHVLLPLMERLPDHQLIVAGNNGDAYARRLMETAEKVPNVKIIGPVDDSERRWLYAHCEGLLFPSLAEGFGLPVIEAMQWGKPVFCSTSTSLPEIGGTHACYFRTFEAGNMANVVLDGLKDYTEEKAAAAQAYATTFSYDRHLRRYAELLTDGQY